MFKATRVYKKTKIIIRVYDLGFIKSRDEIISDYSKWKYAAVDENGGVYIYTEKPHVREYENRNIESIWEYEKGGSFTRIGTVIYEGEWRDSLVELKPENFEIIVYTE